MTGRALIVDGSLTVRMEIQEALQAAGLDTTLCAGAAEARSALARDGFTLIVLDALLPDADGLDLLSEIRASPATAATPVVLTSTAPVPAERLAALSGGPIVRVDKALGAVELAARVAALPREAAVDPPAGRAAPRAGAVLVIDDSLTFREEMGEALRRVGYEVLLAETGEEGLRLAAERRPAAAVIDGTLPGIDGLTVVRRLRADAALRGTPCLLLTATAAQHGELQSLEAGADAYLVKGEDIEVILARLAALLRSAGAPRAFALESISPGPRRLLAVDDSPTYLAELTARLSEEGYDVLPARSGEEAIERLRTESVDCILMDLMMPGLSGHETCRLIKGDPRLRDVPLLMLTANEERDALIEGLNAGADDFIAKSGDFAVLKGRLRAQLRRKQYEAENRRIREELLRKEHEASEARAVRQSEELLRKVLETLPVAVWVIDKEGRILLANPAGKLIWGDAKHVGIEGYAACKAWWAHSGEPIAPREWAAARAIEKGEVSIDEMVEIERFDGSRRTILNSSIPIREPDGRISGAIAVNQDVTERRRAEQALRESEERFRTLAETMPQIVWTAGRDGAIDYFNDHWFAYTGMDPEGSRGSGWKSALHPDDLRPCQDRWRRSVETGEPYEIEHRFRRAADGAYRWHLARALPLRDGEERIVKWIGTSTDVHDGKLLETALQEKNRELERARARAEEESRFKSKFLANMSHELRTPLNAIIGFSELLEQELFGPLEPRQRDYVTNVLTSGRHLLQLINDVLDISRIEAGRMELACEWMSLAEAVEGVQAVVGPLAGKKGIALEVDLPARLPELYADPLRIKQVLYNLLSNSIKFTPRSGTARLKARAADGGVRIMVEDTGVGIRPEDMPRLFREFERIESAAGDKPEGTGLGLALTRRLVELHGGSITAASEVGRGSTFTVVLPIPSRAAPVDAFPVGDTGPPGSLVLVVEDDPKAAELISGHLRSAGLPAAFARDGAEALRMAAELQPAAITLDLILPDASGWSVLGRLKESEATRSIPVVVISVVDEPGRGLVLGATDYLVKPISRERLLETMTKVGMAVPRVQGLRILLVGNGDSDMRSIEEHLRSAGCIVQRAVPPAGEPLGEWESVDLAVVDLSRDTASRASLMEEFLDGARHRSIPILGVVDPDAVVHPSLIQKVERVVRPDAMRHDRLLRAVRRAIDRTAPGA